MATKKQRLAAENMAKNGGIASKAMRDAGYSPKTAKTPSKLTSTKGFMELMDEYGLTDELIIKSLVHDIKKKPGGRTQELTLAVKMRGRITEKADHTTLGESINPFTELSVEELRKLASD